MMVVDSSAIVAILQKEDGWRDLFEAVRSVDRAGMSAAMLVEAGMVVEARRGERGAAVLDRLLRRFGIEIVPFDRQQAVLARAAFRRIGKRRHPANLNFGDCLAYVAARHFDAPLLFTGDDFRRTDIVPALPA